MLRVAGSGYRVRLPQPPELTEVSEHVFLTRLVGQHGSEQLPNPV